jgi:type IV pilus assembly protein PilO
MKLRRGDVFNLLNIHFAGVALLVLLNLTLCVRLFLAWNTLRSSSEEQLRQQQATLRALQLEMTPLKGLPQKVALSHKQADAFYTTRFPGAYSTISAAISDLEKKSSVRLTSLAYTQAPGLPGLTEIRMDASLSGQYSALMHFINGLERSKTFFVISNLTLTGSQGGMVNLRLRLSTYLDANGKIVAAPANLEDQAPQEENQ